MERNVVLVEAAVGGGGSALCDEPKQRLRRRLLFFWIIFCFCGTEPDIDESSSNNKQYLNVLPDPDIGSDIGIEKGTIPRGCLIINELDFLEPHHYSYPIEFEREKLFEKYLKMFDGLYYKKMSAQI